MWPKTAAVLLLGYLCISRAFAYIGIPAWKIFIGEAVLVCFFLWGPKLNDAWWPFAAAKSAALKRFSVAYSVFAAYGLLQVVHGIVTGNPPFLALRDFAFHYYPIYILLGLWAGLQRPDLFPRVLRAFAWFNGLYGLFYILLFNRLQWFFPGVGDDIAPVAIFGEPVYSFIALLALIAYEKDLWRSLHLIILNAFVMLGMQLRAEWLAFAVGLTAWFVITRQGKRLLQTAAVLIAIFTLMYITDFRLPGPENRGGGEISIRQLTSRALAPFTTNLSSTGAASGISADTEEATIAWRTVWWLMIWSSVHSSASTAAFGFGYGYPLADLAPYLEGDFIRTPHNEFFYVLGYTGWLGVVIFFAFQSEIVRLLWRAHRNTGESFGVPLWIAVMAYSMFFPLGETPYGAIPFYLLVGWLAAPVLRQTTQPAPARYTALTDYFPGATASGVFWPRRLTPVPLTIEGNMKECE